MLTLGRLVLAEKDRKLGEDAHVCPLQAETSFQKADDLLEVAAALVHGDERTELLSMNNDVKTADFSLKTRPDVKNLSLRY